ncbi:UvrD-helicase domain-containing protein [Deinococcus aquaedulcis]|uniref:UvrD-helicase domain-containing protein n=1 Tax=Deinococcus aquaedulcis TaxID=2840455 RepID=UPI001C830C1D|nr:UvrD-helicase domain-containing protein [Deinococcus aquaedulcis]
MTLTQEQTLITEYRGSVSIDAGAGSGKTFVLTRRLLGLLTHDLAAEELVAVTFTEAAAAELRGRLQALLDEEAQRRAQPRVVAAAQALPLAQISTIHALCTRIIREHPVESGAGLRFEVLDEAGAEVWLDQTLPQVLGALNPEAFGHLPTGLAREAVALMLRDPQRAEDALRVSLAEHDARRENLEAQLAEQAEAAAQVWAEQLTVLAAHACPDPADALELARQAALQAAAVQGSWPARQAAMRAALSGTRANAGNAKVWGSAKAPVLRAVARLKSLASPDSALESEYWQLRAIPVLEGLYREVQARLDTLKAQQERLTFADLERLAARALSFAHVREYYASRWKAVFVDEFQDTSPLQWEILSAISSGGVTFTVVGDEKQSIYAFRGADVRLFRKAREQIVTSGGQSRALSRSFRTHQALVDVLNAFFQHYMPGPVGKGSTAATFAPLTAHRTEKPSAAPSCELHVISGPVNKPVLRSAESDLLAHRIQSLMAEGRVVQEGQELRPLTYRDIAVLFRARTNLPIYESALFHAGIPYTVQGGRGLLTRPEVRDLMHLLLFLARPGDDVALAAVLRSPLVGWEDEALLAASQGRVAGQSLWSALQAAALTPPLLLDLLDRRASTGASGLVTHALEASEHGVIMASLPDGTRRLANIDAFLALLHSLALQGQGDVSAAARALRDTRRLDLAVPEANLASDDAVQLMTIHGSKGLEFPVVMVPDLLAQGRADSSPLLMDAERGLALRVPGLKPEQQPGPHQRLQDLQAERRAAENERIMYVALTRAADTLILSVPAKVSETAEAARISSMFPQDDVARYAYAPGQIPRPAPQLRQRTGTVRTSAASSGVALPESLPATSIGVYLTCPKAFEFRYVTGRPPFTRLWEPETQRLEGGAGGALIGSAVHQAIELELSGPQIMARFAHLSFEQRQEVAALSGKLGTPTFSALAGQEPRREVPVSHAVNGVTFEGVVDALYEDWIVDFKTDRHVQPDHHAAQLALYLDATGASRASLAYLRHDLLYDLSRTELEQAKSEMTRMVSGVRAHDFTPAPSPERCRWCQYRQVCSASAAKEFHGTGH